MRRIIVLGVLSLAGCSGQSPSTPTAVQPHPAVGLTAGGSVSASANQPPALALRTTPALRDGSVYGQLPLDVGVNLCQSSDPDAGDSLRFDVTWGDGVETGPDDPGAGTSVGDGGPPTGCDGTSCCRHRHRFEQEGTYTVEVRVSDKHLEDQSNKVSAQAISRTTFVVRAGAPIPPLCSAQGPGFFSATANVGMPATQFPIPLPIGVPSTTFTSYSGNAVPYFLGTLAVTASGSYTGILNTGVTANGFFILNSAFAPSTGTPATPLSAFIIGSQGGSGSPTTISGIALEPDRIYWYLLLFNPFNGPVTFTLSGPGGACIS